MVSRFRRIAYILYSDPPHRRYICRTYRLASPTRLKDVIQVIWSLSKAISYQFTFGICNRLTHMELYQFAFLNPESCNYYLGFVCTSRDGTIGPIASLSQIDYITDYALTSKSGWCNQQSPYGTLEGFSPNSSFNNIPIKACYPHVVLVSLNCSRIPTLEMRMFFM